MLPKKNRADKKAVEEIFRKGKVVSSPLFTFKFVIADSKFLPPQISIIVPKTISKEAVNRNSLRRFGYSVLRKYIAKLPLGLAGVFIFKKYPSNIPIIDNEIKDIFNKIS